ncbi:hypothetical protein BFJ66_g6581 [Fusarium oxysporum f. sp. cepae]|uniref:Uncharacterized protein n=1 Tax=Fusarium oxysporum f. sp. cepae TaxID=396571 RepID=A0A3L6NMI2_FUSOX|nr:hypothetical protein BFJ65_g6511 [Fusarium oxysporum f. sp. cepae]RKK50526.1 hypothetical protein BFJ66_g6581 [Fusarium oxysporum f. sp. cepae]
MRASLPQLPLLLSKHTNYSLLTFQTRNHPLRQKLTPGSTATVHSARPLTPSQSQGNQRGVDTPCPIPAVSAPSPTTIPQTPTKRKRHGAILPSGHMFAWHRGRQVNLTTEVEPLMLNHPSVQSASCLS